LASVRLCGFLLLLEPRHAFLRFTREVRDDAEHALHEHQLRAVVHLVFFRREQQIEPGA
jgi:hypothetical protein